MNGCINRRLVFVLSVFFVIVSCAKSVESARNEDERDYLNAWMERHYPEVPVSNGGIYIISDKEGSGTKFSNSRFAVLEYTVRDLKGNILGTTDKELSKQLGLYSPVNYYGERLWVIMEETVSAGVEEMLKGMKVGGTRTAVIPSWMNVRKRYKNNEEYFKHESEEPHVIYTIKLKDIVKNIDDRETLKLRDYSDKYLGGMDTTSYGFYYKRIAEPVKVHDFPHDTTILINYTGRRLDGSVFDTNIADTAKMYEIYSPKHNYGPSKIRWAEKIEDISMVSRGNVSKLIPGFRMTLWKMHSGEKGIGVFISKYGYSVQGSGPVIPPCAPLRFDIEIVANRDGDNAAVEKDKKSGLEIDRLESKKEEWEDLN